MSDRPKSTTNAGPTGRAGARTQAAQQVPGHATRQVIDNAGNEINLKDKEASGLDDVRLNAFFSNVYAKLLVKNLGERAAAAVLLRMRPKLSLQEWIAEHGSEQYAKHVKAVEFAIIFWNKLIKAVGERQAEHIMRTVMATKREGRYGDLSLWNLIFSYIYMWGRNESDGKITQRIFDSNPYYVRCKSGELGIVNDWMTEQRMCWDETIVERTPLNKNIKTLEKLVGRIRRWAIEEQILPQEYAPRAYYRG